MFQVTDFLMGLQAISEWDTWTEGHEAADLQLDLMLRPLAVDDFSNQLAGDLAPLNVHEWRSCTDPRDFYYDQAHKVNQLCFLVLWSLSQCHLVVWRRCCTAGDLHTTPPALLHWCCICSSHCSHHFACSCTHVLPRSAMASFLHAAFCLWYRQA